MYKCKPISLITYKCIPISLITERVSEELIKHSTSRALIKLTFSVTQLKFG